MTMTREKQIMAHEIERVQRMITTSINEIEEGGGSIRFFNAAVMSAAMVLHAEVEGPETLDATMTKAAQRILVAKGAAGQC